jgi:hypothetical protein
MSSQQSYQSILGKFTDGLEVLKKITGYSPVKEELKLASLVSMKSEAELRNAAATSTAATLQDLRNTRRSKSFHAKDTDTNCMENLIRNIASYLKAELGSSNAAFVKVASIIKRFTPPAEKKIELKEGEEPKKSISQSEKSYQSLVGFAKDVLTLITGLGQSYGPTNENITVAGFKAKVDELVALNAEIVKAENDYKTAVQARNEIFRGEVGVISIMSSIKNYLASLEGGKNNLAYIGFVNAVK